MARASIPAFADKKEKDPMRFLLQVVAILSETGINGARWPKSCQFILDKTIESIVQELESIFEIMDRVIGAPKVAGWDHSEKKLCGNYWERKYSEKKEKPPNVLEEKHVIWKIVLDFAYFWLFFHKQIEDNFSDDVEQ